VPGSGCVAPADIDAAFSQLIANTLRMMALDEGVRADGRGLSDLRSVFCEVPMSNEIALQLTEAIALMTTRSYDRHFAVYPAQTNA